MFTYLLTYFASIHCSLIMWRLCMARSRTHRQ